MDTEQNEKGVVLSHKESVCVAMHLIAQHRQAVYRREASVLESCENCPIYVCRNCNKHTWGRVYEKICRSAGIKYSFCKGVDPMLPY